MQQVQSLKGNMLTRNLLPLKIWSVQSSHMEMKVNDAHCFLPGVVFKTCGALHSPPPSTVPCSPDSSYRTRTVNLLWTGNQWMRKDGFLPCEGDTSGGGGTFLGINGSERELLHEWGCSWDSDHKKMDKNFSSRGRESKWVSSRSGHTQDIWHQETVFSKDFRAIGWCCSHCVAALTWFVLQRFGGDRQRMGSFLESEKTEDVWDCLLVFQPIDFSKLSLWVGTSLSVEQILALQRSSNS